MMHRMAATALLFAASAAVFVQPSPPFELEEATIAQLQQWMQDGRYTSRRLVDLYLERIARIDRAGPSLRSVSETNPDARRSRTRSTRSARPRARAGPLHGIPVLIKDNIDTGDRMTTTAGSLALEGSVAPRDAFVVDRLRRAGAVILGKTNLSEWANFRSTKSTSGWSGRGGQVQEPVRPRSQPVRVELGNRHGDRGEPRGRRRRHRDRRLDRLPVVGVGARRHQADRRPRQPHGHHSDLAVRRTRPAR